MARLVKLFFAHLVDIGVATPTPLTPSQSERAQLLSNFEAYLLKQRGLSTRSTYHGMRFANRFLDHCFGQGRIDLACLSATDIVSFMERLVQSKAQYRDKTIATHLRSFFQYLFARGLTKANLALCVPRVRAPWGKRLPRYLQPSEVEEILASACRSPNRGTRDYAMLLLMARLGLRAPEIVAMQLDDIDWRSAEIIIRGKGQRQDRLPLTDEVGSAISDYLQKSRPSTATRRLFVSYRAPNLPLKDGSILNRILKEAFATTGIRPAAPYVGAHVFRHSLATNMVRSGASLAEIGDLLRHRSRATTMIYAKLDTDGLRSIAPAWPVMEDAR